VLSLRKPSASTIRDFLAAQVSLDLTYLAVGATADSPPPEYDCDHTRIKLGDGEQVFETGKAALERWEHFHLGWVEACPPDTPIQVGQVVAVVAWNLGLWWVNAARIIYKVDEDGPLRRFGFAYGTLPDHVESGEERFMIEWDRATGSVCYDILAFSRPRHVLAWLGYPWVRRVQRRFARASAAAMERAVSESLAD
jgi:uncharacterized protein (UPF0548 family)